MASIKFLFFFALAIAFVMAAEPERVKKDVIIGGAYPYAYSGVYPAAYPTYTTYSGIPYSGVYPYGYRSVVY